MEFSAAVGKTAAVLVEIHSFDSNLVCQAHFDLDRHCPFIHFKSSANSSINGCFAPALAKHTKHVSLVDNLSVRVDRMQRNFEPMRKQVELGSEHAFRTRCQSWLFTELLWSKLDVSKLLARRAHDLPATFRNAVYPMPPVKSGLFTC